MGFRRARLAARSVGVVQSGPSHGAADRLHVRAAACAGVGGAEGQGSVSWMRSVRLFTALLQLSLPGAAAWADAQLDSAGAHATAHVESHTTSACARIHPPDCALCHFLTAPALTGRATPLRLDVADRLATRPVDPAGTARALARPHPQPRAPPALS